jgi:hypothetical protein
MDLIQPALLMRRMSRRDMLCKSLAIQHKGASMPGEQDQSATVAFLQAQGDGVERIDTHGAMIFLAGDQVFKLKRAVDLGYLNFASLAAREDACRAELTLNRRTAPDLYLDVRSIRAGTDGALNWDVGDVVDWVVVMRRFPATDLLTHVAERGELTQTLLHALADGVAEFHARAEIMPVTDGAGRMRDVIMGNERSFAAVPTGLLPPPMLRGCRRPRCTSWKRSPACSTSARGKAKCATAMATFIWPISVCGKGVRLPLTASNSARNWLRRICCMIWPFC